MAKIERFAAKGVWDPPTYSQGVKVTGAQTILYLAGQVAYDDKGGPAHRGDFKAQARAVLPGAEGPGGGGRRHDGQHREDQHLPHRHPPPRRLASIREEFIGKKSCASTLVGVAALAMPEWLIEIEAIAVL